MLQYFMETPTFLRDPILVSEFNYDNNNNQLPIVVQKVSIIINEFNVIQHL